MSEKIEVSTGLFIRVSGALIEIAQDQDRGPAHSVRVTIEDLYNIIDAVQTHNIRKK